MQTYTHEKKLSKTLPAGGIDVLDLDVRATLESPAHELAFLGPTIRGGLGYALKRRCQPNCNPSQETEPVEPNAYSMVFEGRPPEDRKVMRRYDAVPPPFALRLAAPGQWDGGPTDLRFSVRLFGDAAIWLPDIVASIEQLGSDGVGKNRVRFDVDSMTPRTILRCNDRASVAISHLDPVPRDGRLRWTFETPVQLTKGRSDSRPLIRPLQLILAGRRRWHVMTSLFGEPTSRDTARLEEDEFRVTSNSIQTWSINRFSGRQKRSIPLSGFIGEMDIEGPWSQAGDWITAIRHLHLGKHVSFGFGRVTWSQCD